VTSKVLEHRRRDCDAELGDMLGACAEELDFIGERLKKDTEELVARGRMLLESDPSVNHATGKKKKKSSGAQQQSTAMQQALLAAISETQGLAPPALSSAGDSSRFSDSELIRAALLESVALDIADFQAQRDALRHSNNGLEVELSILVGQLRTLAGGSEEEMLELAKALLTVDDEHIPKPAGGVESSFTPDTSPQSESLEAVEMYDVAGRAGFREVRNAWTNVSEHELAAARRSGSLGHAGDAAEERFEDDIYHHERSLNRLIHHMMVAVANITTFHSNLEIECTCKQCLKIFTDPRTLWPCGHTFCGACLQQLEDAEMNIVCSECNSVAEMGHIAHPALELVAHYQRMNIQTAASLGGGPQSTTGKDKSIYTILEALASDLASAKHGGVSRCVLPSSRPLSQQAAKSPQHKSLAGPSRPVSPSAATPLPTGQSSAAASPVPVSPEQMNFSAPSSACSTPGASALPPAAARRGTLQFTDFTLDKA
jgi:hypothetical protein